MEEGSLASLLTIFGLVLLHSLLTLSHAAFANVRVTALRHQADDGNVRAQRVLDLVHKTPNLTLTYQLLVTLLKFMIAAVALMSLIVPFSAANGMFEIAVVLVLMLIGILTLIIGELVPESVGSTYPNAIALSLAGPMALLILLLSPLTGLVLLLSRAISSAFRSSDLVNRVTEEEIVTMIESGHTGGTIEEEEKDMILSVLQLDQTGVAEVMVPRIDIVAIDIDTPLAEARARFIESGFSRIPVYEGTIDTIRGLLYAKDLLAYWHSGRTEQAAGKTIQDLMRPVYFVPETKPVDELLKELQARRVHMAIVVDEYGGTAGLVTIENIIEEIIGDIQDEYDLNEEVEYVQIGEREYTVDASIDLDDFNDLLDVELPTEDSNTLAGFIYSYFGRIPLPGEEFVYDEDLLVRVETVDGRRIRKVYVKRMTSEEEAAHASTTVEAAEDRGEGETEVLDGKAGAA